MIFSGGILTRGITEVAGESASGKTQLGMQLCIQAQLSKDRGGLTAGFFLHTEIYCAGGSTSC